MITKPCAVHCPQIGVLSELVFSGYISSLFLLLLFAGFQRMAALIDSLQEVLSPQILSAATLSRYFLQ
jgi:hypothetical protein